MYLLPNQTQKKEIGRNYTGAIELDVRHARTALKRVEYAVQGRSVR